MDKIKSRIKILKDTNKIALPLDEDNYVKLFSQIKNSSNKIEDTKKYTNDFKSLIELINEIKPKVNQRTKTSLASYIKHLKKGIKINQLVESNHMMDTTDIESDST